VSIKSGQVHIGSDNYEVAINCNNLAALCQAKGNPAEAEQLYPRSLVIKRSILGTHHPDVAVTINNLAVLHKSQGNSARQTAPIGVH
jgi:hypothetical protein